MVNVPSSPSRFRSLLQHAPWFTISTAFTVMVLGVTSLVYFQEEPKPKHAEFVLSMPRDPNQEKIPITPLNSDIVPAPIPVGPMDPVTEPNSSAEPIPLVDPKDYMISDVNSTDGGDKDIDAWKGKDPSNPILGDPNGSMFDAIGSGSNSGPKIGGGGDPFGGGRKTIRVDGPPGSKTIRPLPIAETLDGLLWLARHQSPDGSWSPSGFSDRCKTEGSRCGGGGRDNHIVGTTGLALLAFLGAGFHQFESHQVFDKFLEKQVSFKRNVVNGLQWLMDHQREDGALGEIQGEFFYDHAIGTMALCEAYAMARTELGKNAAQKAVEFLLRHQSSDPSGTGFLGWRYMPGSGQSDTSATGWCVMALKSAELAGLGTYTSSMMSAVQFVRSVTNAAFIAGYLSRDDAGQKTYVAGMNEDFENHPALTAVAMCINSFARHEFDDPSLAVGAKALVGDLPIAGLSGKKTKDYYYWYYGSLALYQYDGPDSPRKDGSLWKRWNEAMLKALTGEQKKMGAGCAIGSWDPDDRWGWAGGRVYATAINTLTLEVYYRYPNAFLGHSKPGVEASSKPKPPK